MIDISHALTIQGWMSEDELLWLAEIASKCTTSIIEIGSYKGRSSCAIAANTRALVYCVDIWSECGTDGWYYDVFRENTMKYLNIIPINRASIWAAREMAAWGLKAGMIFIDAAHDHFNVRKDIEAWRPLLADNGIFCGHDYNHEHHPDVKKVVDEMIPKIKVVDTIWIEER